MAINRNSGEAIELQEAKKFVKEYGEMRPGEIRAFFAGGGKIQDILSQEGCVGIRMYNGYDADNQCLNLVIVGVNEDGNDIVDGIVLDRLHKCPEDCSPETSLMD